MALPPFNEQGDLLPGIYSAPLAEVLQRFGTGSVRRQLVARRLERIYKLARSTGCLARFVVFGSLITAKHEPGDVDIFMLMEDNLDVSQVQGEAAIIFNHMAAQNIEGTSFFGFAGLPHSRVNRPRSSTGKSSGTNLFAASWRW